MQSQAFFAFNSLIAHSKKEFLNSYHRAHDFIASWVNPVLETVIHPESSIDFFIGAQNEIYFKQYQSWRNQFKAEMHDLRYQLIKGYQFNQVITPDNLHDHLINFQNTLSPSFASGLYYQGYLKKLANKLPAYKYVFDNGVNEFKNKLKKQPPLALNYFYQDVINYIVLLAGDMLSVQQLMIALSFYQELIPVELYEKVKKLLEQFDTQHQQFIKNNQQSCAALPASLFKNLIKNVNDEISKHIFSRQHTDLDSSKQTSLRFSDVLYKHGKKFFSSIAEHPKLAFGFLGGGIALTYAGRYSETYDVCSIQNSFSSFVLPENFAIAPLALTYTLQQILPANIYTSINLGLLMGMSFASSLTQAQHIYKRAVDSEFLINSQGSPSAPAVVGLNNGNMLVLWEYNPGGQYDIRGQFVDSVGNLINNTFLINTNTAYSQTGTRVARLKNGNIAVTWNTQNPFEAPLNDIALQMLTANGSKLNNEIVVNTYTSDNQIRSAIAALENGGFVVVWASQYQDGSSWGIYGQRFDNNGNKVGDEFRINNYTSDIQTNPAASALKNGGFVVVWEGVGEPNSSGYDIYGQRFDNDGNSIGSAFLINTFLAGVQTNPTVVWLANGGFFVTWDSTNQIDSIDIFGQFFDANGAKVGSEFLINTSTPGAQQFSSTCLLANGDIAVVWQGIGDDPGANNIDIYLQIISGTTRNKIGVPLRINTTAVSNQYTPYVSLLSNNNIMAVWSDNQNAIYGRILATQINSAAANQQFGFSKNINAPLRIPFNINNPDFMLNATLTLTLPNTTVGKLLPMSNQNISSTFNNQTGVWQISGNVNEINGLLNTPIVFQPAANYTQTFDIHVSIDNGFSPLINTSINALFTREFLINTNTTDFQSFPKIAKLNNGNNIVVWDGRENGGWPVINGQLTNQNLLKISSSFQISPVTPYQTLAPTVTALLNGNFLVAWQQVSTNNEIGAQLFQSDGTKIGNSFFISLVGSSSLYSQAYTPTLATLTNGNIVAVWTGTHTTEDDNIIGRIVSAAGNLLGSEFRLNVYTSNKQHNPTVAALNGGRFVSAWMSYGQVGYNYEIYMRLFDATGTGLTSEIAVNTLTSGIQTLPHIGKLASGEFIVAWLHEVTGGYSPYIRHFFANGTAAMSVEQSVVADLKGLSESPPYVCAFNHGGFGILFSPYDAVPGNEQDVYIQAFNAQMNRVGSAIRVNDYSKLPQHRQTAIVLDNQNVLATWAAYQQYNINDSYDIYAGQINTKITATNTNQTLFYSANQNTLLFPITITPPEFINTLNVSLQIPANSGVLFTSIVNNNTATFTNNTWQAQGAVSLINNLLANLYYQPAAIQTNFTINVLIQDLFNLPINGVINLNYVPSVTTGLMTTGTVTTGSVTTGAFTSGVVTTGTPTTTQGTSGGSATSGNEESTTSTTGMMTTTSSTTSSPVSSTTGAISTSSTTANSVTTEITTGSTTAQTTGDQSTTHTFSTESTSTNEATTSLLSTSGTTTEGVVTTSFIVTTASTAGSTTSTSQSTVDNSNEAFNNLAPSDEEICNAGCIAGITMGVIAAASVGAAITFFACRNENQRHKMQHPVDLPLQMPPKAVANLLNPKEHYGVLLSAKNRTSTAVLPSAYRVLTLDNEMQVRLLNHKIGKGNSGKVVLGQELETGKLVAVKKVYDNSVFDREISNLGMRQEQPRHSNVVHNYGHLITYGRKHKKETAHQKLYVFDHYLTGESGLKLKSTLSTDWVLRFEELKLFAQDLLNGFKRLHTKQIYHLDFHPENFMLDKLEEDKSVTNRQVAVIIDLGCAQNSPDGQIKVASTDGNQKYYSPQRLDAYRYIAHMYLESQLSLQISKDKIIRIHITAPSFYQRDYFYGAAEDAWALGLTLLELLLGKHPFAEEIDAQYPSLATRERRFNYGTPDFFNKMLGRLEEIYPWFKNPDHPLVQVIKGLLIVDDQQRLTIDKALDIINPPLHHLAVSHL